MLIVKEMSKNHQPIIMHYVNKVKGYLNFHVKILKLLKNWIHTKLYVQMNSILNVTTMNNIDH
jgi:hypothetical protein